MYKINEGFSQVIDYDTGNLHTHVSTRYLKRHKNSSFQFLTWRVINFLNHASEQR